MVRSYAYWQDGGKDCERAREILKKALVAPPRAPKVLARAVQIVRRAEPPTSLDDRICHRLIEPMQRIRRLLALIDALGDGQVDVQHAVFDLLVKQAPEVELAEVDPRALQQARLGAPHRPGAAARLLDALGWKCLPEPFAEELRRVLEATIESANRYQAHLLVVSPDGYVGLPLGVQVMRGEHPGVTCFDSVDSVMAKQAKIVLDACVTRQGGLKWSLKWPVRYSGESLGLALKLAAMVSFEGLRPDPLLAATGTVEGDGRVAFVEGINAKLMAAYEAGFRRVLLPADNRSEAKLPEVGERLQLVFVEHVDDIISCLADTTVRSEFSLDGRVRLARASLPRYKLTEQREVTTQNSKQLHVADAAGRAILNIFTGAKGKITATGPAGPTRQVVERLVKEVFEREPTQRREPRSWTVPEEWRQQHLRESLERQGADARETRRTGEVWRYALRRGGSTADITLWRTDQCRLTGNAPAFDEIVGLVEQALEGLANVRQTRSSSSAYGQQLSELPKEGPWIGTDESGKGDYFGPLVSAAVYVDRGIARKLEALACATPRN